MQFHQRGSVGIRNLAVPGDSRGSVSAPSNRIATCDSRDTDLKSLFPELPSGPKPANAAKETTPGVLTQGVASLGTVSLGTPGSHFDIGIESPTFTVLYGRPWRRIDDTQFTTANVQDPVTGTLKVTFHPWMLYVAGMKHRYEVPQMLMDVEPDNPPTNRYDLVTTTGTYEMVHLQDVIEESGDRRAVNW